MGERLLRRQQSFFLTLCVVLLFANIGLFWGSFNLNLSHDDMLLQQRAIEYLSGANSCWIRAKGAFFRPADDAVFTLNMYLFGWNTFFLRTLSFIGHFGVALMTAIFAWRIARSAVIALLSALILMSSQATASAIFECCAMGTIYCTLHGLVGLYLIYRPLSSKTRVAEAYILNNQCVHSLLAASIICFGFMWKESTIGFVAIAICAGTCAIVFSPRTTALRKYGCWIIASNILLLIGFLALRYCFRTDVPSQQEGHYYLRFGVHVLTNCFLLLGVSVWPASTPATMLALQDRALSDIIFIIISSVGASCYAFFCLTGILHFHREQRFLRAPFLLLTILLSLGPVLLMRRVSELYCYMAMPCLAILIAVGIVTSCRHLRQRRALVSVVYLLVAACVLGNTFSLRSKMQYRVRNGNIARRLVDAAKDIVSRSPGTSSLGIGWLSPDPITYSIYLEGDLTGIIPGGIIATSCGLPEHAVSLIDLSGKQGTHEAEIWCNNTSVDIRFYPRHKHACIIKNRPQKAVGGD